jgi:hypothetical protein
MNASEGHRWRLGWCATDAHTLIEVLSWRPDAAPLALAGRVRRRLAYRPPAGAPTVQPASACAHWISAEGQQPGTAAWQPSWSHVTGVCQEVSADLGHVCRFHAWCHCRGSARARSRQ